MKIDISRDEMINVLLTKIADMDPEEAREELYEFYADRIYPQLKDEELAAEFYEKIVHFDAEDEIIISESQIAPH